METQIVHVPVPIEHLSTVYSALAVATSREPLVRIEPESAPIGRPLVGDAERFGPRELSILKKNLRSDSGAFALIELCASHPGELIGYDHAVEVSGIEGKKLRGQLGAFTKLLKRLFNDNKWPIEADWAVGGKVQYYYSMKPEIAKVWKSL